MTFINLNPVMVNFQVKIAIYDWDIVWKSACLGSTTLDIGAEGQTEAVWHVLDSPSGQVCIQLMTKRYPVSASGDPCNPIYWAL
jgi:hypothetical protein